MWAHLRFAGNLSFAHRARGQSRHGRIGLFCMAEAWERSTFGRIACELALLPPEKTYKHDGAESEESNT